MASVRLTFQLEGFSPAVVSLGIPADGEATVPTQRLKLAGTSETVVVRGEARVIAPAPPPRVPSRPPAPRPVLKPVPDHDRDSICGPAKPSVKTEALGTIRSGRSSKGNGLFVEGDELSIDGDGYRPSGRAKPRRAPRLPDEQRPGRHRWRTQRRIGSNSLRRPSGRCGSGRLCVRRDDGRRLARSVRAATDPRTGTGRPAGVRLRRPDLLTDTGQLIWRAKAAHGHRPGQ